MKGMIAKTLLAAVACLALGACLKAQEAAPQGYELVDSVIYAPAAKMDSTLLGRDIFSMVKVRQSQDILDAFNRQVEANPSRERIGYRVRIFFDNRQSARSESESAMRRFESSYPGIPTYRSYENPYFKVTVGDFRTKSEALSLLQRIKGDFPSAFVVKGMIQFPVTEGGASVRVDTVSVLRAKR